MLPADARTSFSRTRNTYSIFACGAPPPPPSGSNATVSEPGRFFAYLCVRFFLPSSGHCALVRCSVPEKSCIPSLLS